MAGYAFGNGLMLDPAEEFRAGGERGRQSRLRDLMGQAATADPEQRGSLLGQIMATDPETGFKAQKAFGEADDDAFDAITRTASMMVSAPPQLRQSLYPRLVQATRRVMPQAQFPDAWDETQLPHIRDLSRMATKAGDTPAQQQYAEWLLGQVPADKRDKTLGFLAGYESRPSSAAIQYKDGEDEQGNPIVRAYDPRQVGAQVIGSGETYGSGVGQPAPMQAPPQRMDEERIYQIANSMVGKVPEPQIEAWLQQQLSAPQYVGAAPAPQAIPTAAPQASVLPPRLDYQNGGTVNPWRGRRKEDEEAAKEAAKQRVALDFLPAQERIKADSAIRQAEGTEAAKRRASADSKRDEERIKGEGKLQGILDRQAMVAESIDDALAAPGFDANFGWDSPRRFVPGTEAANAKTRIKTVMNQIRLNVLSDLKAMSPTGGAVGQVSNEEGRVMEGYLGALENSSTDAEARRVMLKIKERMGGMAQRLQDALRRDSAGNPAPAQHGDVDDLLNKYGVR